MGMSRLKMKEIISISSLINSIICEKVNQFAKYGVQTLSSIDLFIPVGLIITRKSRYIRIRGKLGTFGFELRKQMSASKSS
jgi:hypothetical protein